MDRAWVTVEVQESRESPSYSPLITLVPLPLLVAWRDLVRGACEFGLGQMK